MASDADGPAQAWDLLFEKAWAAMVRAQAVNRTGKFEALDSPCDKDSDADRHGEVGSPVAQKRLLGLCLRSRAEARASGGHQRGGAALADDAEVASESVSATVFSTRCPTWWYNNQLVLPRFSTKEGCAALVAAADAAFLAATTGADEVSSSRSSYGVYVYDSTAGCGGTGGSSVLKSLCSADIARAASEQVVEDSSGIPPPVTVACAAGAAADAARDPEASVWVFEERETLMTLDTAETGVLDRLRVSAAAVREDYLRIAPVDAADPHTMRSFGRLLADEYAETADTDARELAGALLAGVDLAACRDEGAPFIPFVGRLPTTREDGASGNDVVACGSVQVLPAEDCAAVGGRAAGIFQVVVAKHARRRGYAKRLISAMILKAAEEGCRYVVLHASEAGLPLYKAMGFRVRGEVVMFLRVPPERRDGREPALYLQPQLGRGA